MPTPLPPLVVGLDTNFILSLADNDERCWSALERLQQRKPPADLVITNTVAEELSHKLVYGTMRLKATASKALKSLGAWNIHLKELKPSNLGIADQIGFKLRNQNILPFEEKNDALILAEAAISECAILISADGHMRDIDYVKLAKVLREAHVKEVAVVTAYQVANTL